MMGELQPQPQNTQTYQHRPRLEETGKSLLQRPRRSVTLQHLGLDFQVQASRTENELLMSPVCSIGACQDLPQPVAVHSAGLIQGCRHAQPDPTVHLAFVTWRSALPIQFFETVRAFV